MNSEFATLGFLGFNFFFFSSISGVLALVFMAF